MLQTRDLPKQALFLLLADTLATDRLYELSVAGVTNINGLGDGGGTGEVLREAARLNVSLGDSLQAIDPDQPPDSANPGGPPGFQLSLQRE